MDRKIIAAFFEDPTPDSRDQPSVRFVRDKAFQLKQHKELFLSSVDSFLAQDKPVGVLSVPVCVYGFCVRGPQDSDPSYRGNFLGFHVLVFPTVVVRGDSNNTWNNFVSGQRYSLGRVLGIDPAFLYQGCSLLDLELASFVPINLGKRQLGAPIQKQPLSFAPLVPTDPSGKSVFNRMFSWVDTSKWKLLL